MSKFDFDFVIPVIPEECRLIFLKITCLLRLDLCVMGPDRMGLHYIQGRIDDLDELPRLFVLV